MAETRKRQVEWKYSEEFGTLRAVQLDDITGIALLQYSQEFKLSDFWVYWDDFDPVQKDAGVYAVKQKLSDKKAKNTDERLTPRERHEQAAELWKQLTEERVWNKVSKDGKPKGPQAALGTVVKNALGMGMTVDQIALLTGKSAEIIARVIVELEK